MSRLSSFCKNVNEDGANNAYSDEDQYSGARSSMTLADDDNLDLEGQEEPDTNNSHFNHGVPFDIPADAMSIVRDVEAVWSFGSLESRLTQFEEFNQRLIEEYFHDKETSAITIRDANFLEKYVTVHLRSNCSCHLEESLPSQIPSSPDSTMTPISSPILHLGRDCHRQFLPVWRFEHRGQWRRFDETNQIHLETIFGIRDRQYTFDHSFPGRRLLIEIQTDDPKTSYKGFMSLSTSSDEEVAQNSHNHQRSRHSLQRLLQRSMSVTTM